MAVIELVSERPLCRARAARRLIDWYTQAAIHECATAVHVLPEEVLADRDALTACLTEQFHALARRKGDEFESLLKADGG
jgi:hypothetical protein